MIDRRRYDRHKRDIGQDIQCDIFIHVHWKLYVCFLMALRKFFADKIRPKVYDLILKIILIAYYVPAGYLLVNIFFDNGYVFDFTGTIIKAFYAISLFWLAGAIATVLKFGERTFRIRREKERCFPCKMYVQKIFEDCKREL